MVEPEKHRFWRLEYAWQRKDAGPADNGALPFKSPVLDIPPTSRREGLVIDFAHVAYHAKPFIYGAAIASAFSNNLKFLGTFALAAVVLDVLYNSSRRYPAPDEKPKDSVEPGP